MDDKDFKGGDTRRSKRLKIEVNILFSIDKSMKEVRLQRTEMVLKGVTKDINEKGVAIETNIFLPLGTMLDLEIHLHKEPDTKFTSPLHVLGRIVATRPLGMDKYRMSIVFVKIEDNDKKALEAYVKEKLEKENHNF